MKKNTHLYFITHTQQLHAWQSEMVASIAMNLCPKSSISFLILNNNTLKEDTFRTPIIISLAYKLDQKLSGCTNNSQLTSHIKALSFSKDVNVLEASQSNLSDPSFLSESVLNHGIDDEAIFINLTESVLPTCFYELNNAYVLSIFFSQLRSMKSSLVGLLEFIQKNKSVFTGIQLEKGENKDNIVLYEAELSLESVSLCRTLETTLHKTSLFLPHVLSDFNHYLQKSNEAHLTISNKQQNLSVNEKTAFIYKFIARIVNRAWYKLTVSEQWIILLGKNNHLNTPSMEFEKFQKISPPRSEFWADPFLIESNGKHYMFFEVFPFATELGHLSYIELYENDTFSQPVKVLQRPYHFSYPNVFNYKNATYMVPETGDEKCIPLYKAKNFPDDWEFQHNLMEGVRAYDSTFIEHNGIWWLFATIAETEQCSTNEELHLFYADSPLSQNWTAHPQNPINTYASSARPGGKIYKEGNKLYRPSQDCAGSYGAAINICEITTLNKYEYEEKIILKKVPDWNKSFIGLHTLNFNSKYTVIDAMIERGFMQ